MQAQDLVKKYIGKSIAAISNMFLMFMPYLFTIYFIIESDFWVFYCLFYFG